MADEIEVKIDPALDLDDKTDEVIVKTADEKVEKVVEPAIADLKAQHDEVVARADREKKAREEAEARARVAQDEAARARAEAVSARTQAAESNLDTINTALQSAKSEADVAERDIQTAGEAGDYAALAKAQRRLAAAEAKILRYDEAKDDLETRKAKADEAPQRREAPADPVEAYIAGRTEPTARWLRDHREWVTDQRKNLKLTAAHNDALSEGLVPDTDEYFSYVEDFIGIGKKSEEQKQPSNVKKLPTRPVAPGANSPGGQSGGIEVRLSQREAAAAKDGTHVWNYDDPSGQKKFKKGDPIGVQEFARRKLEMTKQGVYDKVYAEQ